ncbi:hypothetical protein ABPG72_015198 [Tetrahymena utriculariae]
MSQYINIQDSQISYQGYVGAQNDIQVNIQKENEKKQEFEKQFKIVCQQLENTKDLQIQGQPKILDGSVWILPALNTEENLLYTVKRFSILGEKDSKQLLESAKKEANNLKECYDPRNPKTVKCFDQFQIVNNYYIIMDMCPYNLKQFMDDPSCQLDQEFKYYQTISFAYQIIQGLNQIKSKQCTLKNRQIESILVDSLNQIKLCDFQNIDSQSEISQKPEEQNFYYPPEWDKNKANNEYLKQFKADSWTFGVYFYLLAGGSEANCQQIRNSGYQNFFFLDNNHFNNILSQILCLDDKKRLSIEEINTKFEDLIKEYKQTNQTQSKNDRFVEKIYQKFQEYKNTQKQLAYRYITLCTQIQPQNEKYVYEQGYIQDDLKYHDEAIQSFKQCIELKQGRIGKNENDNDKIEIGNYYYNLGIAQKNQKLLEDAIDSYLKATKKDPNKANYHYNLGIAYVENGDLQKGIKSFTTCLKLDKQEQIYPCNYNIGVAYSEKGQWDKAIKEYTKQIQLLINDINIKHQCYYNMGNAQYEKRKYREAIKSYDLALKEQQDYSTYYNLGMAYLLDKQIDNAIQSFKMCEQLLENKEMIHPVYEQLAMCYKKKEEFEKAKEYYNKCITLDDKEYSYLIDLGGVYEAQKNYQEAIDQYNIYKKKVPNDKRIARKIQNAENKKQNKKFCFFW